MLCVRFCSVILPCSLSRNATKTDIFSMISWMVLFQKKNEHLMMVIASMRTFARLRSIRCHACNCLLISDKSS